MGTKYTTQTQSGFDSSPPADDGSQTAANKIKWATIKTKLASPVLTLAQAINTSLVTALNFGSRNVTATDSVALSDHMKTVQCSGTFTESLPDATATGDGFVVNIKNTGTGIITVALTTAGDTLNGAVNGNLYLDPQQSVEIKTNAAATGYNAIAQWAALAEGSDTLANLTIVPTVNASALTIAIKTRAATDATSADQIIVGMRNATLTSGSFNRRTISAALSLVISSGSTLGQSNGVSATIHVYAIDNAGTIEAAASGAYFGRSGIVTTTAEGGAGGADSASVMYSTTARAAVPFRWVGSMDNTQATAGTWATAPSTVRLIYESTPAYARVVRTAGNVTTTSTSLTDLTGATVTFTTGANPVAYGFSGIWAHSAAGSGGANQSKRDCRRSTSARHRWWRWWRLREYSCIK